MLFSELGLIEPLLKAVDKEGYKTPTPIQEQAIPVVLAGRDLLGCAQTGTGKTASFVLPLLQRMHQQKEAAGFKGHSIKTLVLTPTRELATQIHESIATYGKFLSLRSVVIFGGVPQGRQVQELRKGCDFVVATPFLSATMPPAILSLVQILLTNPVEISVTPEAPTTELVDQSLYYVQKSEKRSLLHHLLKNGNLKSVLVFTRTKHGADRVARDLNRSGFQATALHGDKTQQVRERSLQGFKDGKLQILVATDIAARGIDIDELGLVVNFDLPNIPETYVHRIGRTGRAGAFGKAISFCDYEEKIYLKDIQKLIGQIVPVVTDHPFHVKLMEPLSTAVAAVSSGRTAGGGRRYGRKFSQR